MNLRDLCTDSSLDQALFEALDVEWRRITAVIGEHPDPLTRAAMILLVGGEEKLHVAGMGPGMEIIDRVMEALRRRGASHEP
jgi:hypothetical protein